MCLSMLNKAGVSSKALYVDGQYYRLLSTISEKDKCIDFCILAFYVGKPKSETYVRIRLENNGIVFESTILPIRYEQVEEWIDGLVAKQDEILKEAQRFCMRVEQPFFRHLVDKEKNLNFSYKFVKVAPQ